MRFNGCSCVGSWIRVLPVWSRRQGLETPMWRRAQASQDDTSCSFVMFLGVRLGGVRDYIERQGNQRYALERVVRYRHRHAHAGRVCRNTRHYYPPS